MTASADPRAERPRLAPDTEQRRPFLDALALAVAEAALRELEGEKADGPSEPPITAPCVVMLDRGRP